MEKVAVEEQKVNNFSRKKSCSKRMQVRMFDQIALF